MYRGIWISRILCVHVKTRSWTWLKPGWGSELGHYRPCPCSRWLLFNQLSTLSSPPHLLLVQLVKDLLTSLPGLFSQSRETHSALGPALQAAFKLMSPTGGRVTVFQTQLPTLGAGALQSREDPNQRSSTKVSGRERTCFVVFVLF